MNLTQNKIKEYEELTNWNHHGELLEVIASDLGLTKHKKAFQHINALHELEGNLTQDLQNIRNNYKIEMRNYIVTQTELSDEEKKTILKFI